MCSILPLIAARLLLLAVQWKWSLAKSNNFQVILRIFPTSKFSSWFNRSFISASLRHELSRIRRRAPFPRQRLPSVPDIQSFSPEWRIDCSSIVNQSFTRAVLDGLTSKADVVNFCQLLSLLSMWRQRRQPVRLTPQSSEHQCAIFQINKYIFPS